MSGQLPPARKLPASRALGWLAGCWVLIKQQALRLMLISLFFQFFLGFAQVQALGLLVVLCLPMLSAGMLHAFFVTEQGHKPMLAVLFVTFTDWTRVSRLLLLGAIVMALGLLVMTMILAGQVVNIDPEIITRIEQGDMDALQMIDPQIMENAVFAMAIGAAISASLTYFSVPLIWFANQGIGVALVVGFKALFRNWKPLLAIGFVLFLLAVPVILMFGYFYLSALNGGSASNLLSLLILILGPFYQLLLFGTQYLAFKDIFGMREETGASEPKSADQLVA